MTIFFNTKKYLKKLFKLLSSVNALLILMFAFELALVYLYWFFISLQKFSKTDDNCTKCPTSTHECFRVTYNVFDKQINNGYKCYEKVIPSTIATVTQNTTTKINTDKTKDAFRVFFIGIIVAVVLVVALIALLCYSCCKKHRLISWNILSFI